MEEEKTIRAVELEQGIGEALEREINIDWLYSWMKGYSKVGRSLLDAILTLKKPSQRRLLLGIRKVVSKEWGWKTSIQNKKLKQLVREDNLTRLRINLKKLEEKGLVKIVRDYETTTRGNTRVKKRYIILSKELRTKQGASYMVITKEMFEDMLKFKGSLLSVFFYWYLRATICPDADKVRTAYLKDKRGKEHWVVLGISRSTYYRAMAQLEQTGWLMNNKGTIEILRGDKKLNRRARLKPEKREESVLRETKKVSPNNEKGLQNLVDGEY